MDARIKSGHDVEYEARASPKPHPSVFMLPLSGADDETPSLASSAPMRAFSASFSSRASRAISLTASNSSRLTMSRSRRIFSAWLRTTVSISRLTPWAAPAASFIRRPISSKNRLLVWVISISPVGCAVVGKSNNGDPERAVQGRSCARKSQSACHVPVSLQSYRTSAPSKKPRNRKDTETSHDRPADRNPDQGRPRHHVHHPSRARRPASGHHLLHGRAGDPRGTARHGAPAGHLGLLRDAAEPLLPLGRHGAWAAACRS